MLPAILVLAVVQSALPACQESREPQLEILASVVGATRELIAARPSTDPAVVALLDDGFPFCTGTLIAPTVVVTAAHCFDHAPRHLEIFFGDDARMGRAHGSTIRAIEARVHPGWNGISNDIALVRLESPALVEPKPLVSAGTTDQLPGQRMRIVGFGLQSRDGEPGLKLEGTARVTSVTATTLSHVPDPSATCSGDSGGPGFVMENGREVLAAVHVQGSCGGESTKTRIDAYRDSFIDQFLRGVPAPAENPALPSSVAAAPAIPAAPATIVAPADSEEDQIYFHAIDPFFRKPVDYATACAGLRHYLDVAPNGTYAGVARDSFLPQCPR